MGTATITVNKLKYLPLEKLGAIESSPGIIDFGMFMPGIDNNFNVTVNVITEHDKARRFVAPCTMALNHSTNNQYGDYWSGQFNLSKFAKPDSLSPWGASGVYIYWYTVERKATADMPSITASDIIDPFAREFGFADYSAITIGYKARSWSPKEANWHVPNLKDLMVYEIQINEFGGNIASAIEMLHYIKDLGFNAVEVMPVTNCATTIDWGYDPIGYFGVDNRFGNRANFQEFVNEAHNHGIAVILDMVYGHTSSRFGYVSLYDQLQFHNNPIMRPMGTYGPEPRLNHPLMRDFFFTVNQHWLDAYHVDGIRYDNVNPDWYDEANNSYYADLTASTYDLVSTKISGKTSKYWDRFKPTTGGEIGLIQCAEYLNNPPNILANTYTNCAWQNWTKDAACQAAAAGPLTALGFMSGLSGFPSTAPIADGMMTKTAFQYIENHDHMRFICNFGTHYTDTAHTRVLIEGDRDDGHDIDLHPVYAHWFQTQPYLIMMMTGVGIPMLWEGQEICENYYVLEDWHENSRVRLFRPVRWDKAMDYAGRTLTDLVAKLTKIRMNGDQFRTGDHYFYNDDNYKNNGVLVYSRSTGKKFSLVALNFTGANQSIQFTFDKTGTCKEELQGHTMNVQKGVPATLDIPSNYGCIWTI